MLTRKVIFLIVLVMAKSAYASDNDPLKEAKARLAIELARIETDFRQGLAEADKLIHKNQIKAKEAYESLKTTLEREPNLPDQRKAYLANICKRKIDNLERTKQSDNLAAADLARLEAQRSSRPKTISSDQDIETSRKLKEIRELQTGGQSVEAAKRTADLVRKYPDNPAIIAAAQMQSVRGQLNQNAELRNRFESSNLIALRQIEEAGIPITGDLVFPSDWAEKSKRRSPGAKMSEREKALLKALSTPMNLTIEGENFEYFLTAMEKQLGVSLLVDRPAVEAAGIRMDTPVTVKARNWTGRTVLKKVLSDLGLSYIIRSEEIQITTAERTRETLVTRSYYIGDLLGVSNLQLPPWYNQQQFAQTLASIIESIKSQVDPRSWQPEGAGSIVFEPLSMSLIIRQTAEIHFLLGGALK